MRKDLVSDQFQILRVAGYVFEFHVEHRTNYFRIYNAGDQFVHSARDEILLYFFDNFIRGS